MLLGFICTNEEKGMLPFQVKSKRSEESGGEDEAISNNKIGVHAIICGEFVENIDSGECHLSHQH